MDCTNDIYYMLGIAVVFGSGVVILRKIRKENLNLETAIMRDVGTNTTPPRRNSRVSVASQYGSCDSLDCVVTSPFSSEEEGSEEMSEVASLISGSDRSLDQPKRKYWLNKWLW